MSALTPYYNLPQDHVYVYPAANRSDGGEDNSEKNLRSITGKFAIKSFIVKRNPAPTKEYYTVSFAQNSSQEQLLRISAGECSIDGYYIETKDLEININNEIQVNYNGDRYYLALTLMYDASELLAGDGRSLASGGLVSRGVRVQLLTQEQIDDINTSKRTPFLILGTVKADRDNTLKDYQPAIDRYSFIDSTTVLVEGNSGALTPIEVWTNSRILHEISHNTKLSFRDDLGEGEQYHVNYIDQNGEKKYVPSCEPKAELEIVTDSNGNYDVVFNRNLDLSDDNEKFTEMYPKTISITEIDKRTRISKSGETTEFPGLTTGFVNGATYNGTSEYLCRADHSHDSRYIHKLDSMNVQSVLTPFKFIKIVKFSSGLQGTYGGTGNTPDFHISPLGNAIFQNTEVKELTATKIKVGTKTVVDENGKVYGAVWNDYAELYRKENPAQFIEPGTVICKVKGSDCYAPSTYATRRNVVGVCSDSYGHLLGGDADKTPEENLKNYIPVALAGRVNVKIDLGTVVEEGCLLVPSRYTDGCAEPMCDYKSQSGTVIGKALESSDGSKSKILMQVFLG